MTQQKSVRQENAMTRKFMLAVSLVALLAPLPAFAQAQTGSATPTLPESQIEAAEFSSPFEFVSAATSINEFEIQTSALAERLAESPEVKAFAADMAEMHKASMDAIRAAGAADGVEIAKPSVDGEQMGMIGKLEAQKGAEFDRSYAAAQVYIHQRAIAAYRGYATRTDQLGQFAASTLPAIIEDYAAALQLAEKLGVESAQQTAPAN